MVMRFLQNMNRSKRMLHPGISTALVLVRRFFDILENIAESSNAASQKQVENAEWTTGVLNYRTGNPDDGTDPYGWYESD